MKPQHIPTRQQEHMARTPLEQTILHSKNISVARTCHERRPNPEQKDLRKTHHMTQPSNSKSANLTPRTNTCEKHKKIWQEHEARTVNMT